MEEKNDKIKHSGVLGMRWGMRKGQLTRNPTMFSRKSQEKLDKWELGALQSRKGFRSPTQKKLDAKKIAILKDRLKKPLKDFEPMTKKDQEGFKRIAKVIGVGLLAVGSAKISAKLMDRAMNKYYAQKTADAIGAMILRQRAGNVINLP